MGTRTNWARDRTKTLSRTAKRQTAEIAIMLSGEPVPQPSKSDLRALAAQAASHGVRRLPTMVDLRCGSCGHSGRATVHDDQRGKPFKCSKCGARN